MPLIPVSSRLIFLPLPSHIISCLHLSSTGIKGTWLPSIRLKVWATTTCLFVITVIKTIMMIIDIYQRKDMQKWNGWWNFLKLTNINAYLEIRILNKILDIHMVLSYLSLKKQNTNIDTYVINWDWYYHIYIGVIFSREQDVQQENVIDKGI